MNEDILAIAKVVNSILKELYESNGLAFNAENKAIDEIIARLSYLEELRDKENQC